MELVLPVLDFLHLGMPLLFHSTAQYGSFMFVSSRVRVDFSLFVLDRFIPGSTFPLHGFSHPELLMLVPDFARSGSLSPVRRYA